MGGAEIRVLTGMVDVPALPATHTVTLAVSSRTIQETGAVPTIWRTSPWSTPQVTRASTPSQTSASGASTRPCSSPYPLRQDLAITGAIDQHGHILPVGAVTEKIEGFFEACRDLGMNGPQGVLIPAANRRDLMLNDEVLAAVEAGRFYVFAVETIHEALELLMGIPAGTWDDEEGYPEGTLLAMALDRAFEFWALASARPLPQLSDEASEDEEGPVPDPE